VAALSPWSVVVTLTAGAANPAFEHGSATGLAGPVGHGGPQGEAALGSDGDGTTVTRRIPDAARKAADDRPGRDRSGDRTA
jgi:hypothetical protein